MGDSSGRRNNGGIIERASRCAVTGASSTTAGQEYAASSSVVEEKGVKLGDEGRERHQSSGGRLTRQACHVAAPTQGSIHPARAQHNQASAANEGGGGTTVGYHDNREVVPAWDKGWQVPFV